VKKGLTKYFIFYNQKRWHQNLGRKTPAMVYFNTNRRGRLRHEPGAVSHL